MSFGFQALENIQDIDISLQKLPELCPRFFIPLLPDKPPDPIIDSLNIWRSQAQERPRPSVVHQSPVIEVARGDVSSTHEPDNLWEKAAHEPSTRQSQKLSWDTLRNPSRNIPAPSVFLSERSSQTFSAARYFVDPSFDDPLIQSIFTLPHELLDCLHMSVAGISSPLHVWDSKFETFILRDIHPEKRGILIISGMDEVVSQSLIQRFLTIGTLTRRLEGLVAELRESMDEASLHAFAHALSSVLQSIRKIVARLTESSSKDGSITDIHTLSMWSMACEETETVLQYLASLCGRDIQFQPAQYRALPENTPALLTVIYEELDRHLESQSSKTVNAVFAYLLAQTSEDYLERISCSVGYGDIKPRFSDRSQFSEFTVEGLQDVKAYSDLYQHPFPCFFTPELSQALSRARKSLDLLRVTQPTHDTVFSTQSQEPISWLWSEAEVRQAWYSDNTSASLRGPDASTTSQSDSVPTNTDGFQVFQLFDQEPGTHLGSLDKAAGFVADTGFETFLKAFPLILPSLTPSLSHLAELVLTPLADHASSLSATLVDVLLLPTGYLNFHAHMALLRSYMLLTSHTFKSRLRSALFSDGFEMDEASLDIKTLATSETRPPSSTDQDRWVIGLAAGLTDGDWPPAGADLRYRLRTVIIDSLDVEYPDRQLSQQTNDHQNRLIYEEAEWRLGFAIRDLPTGSGHAKWLNPRSMEALDFLYLDYQPPPPLDVLIPPTTLSKYHRLFAFNLRLMRVENVINALFRMTLKRSTPLFPTFTSSQKLFLHFRFLASSFVASLTSYVYDAAIGENFDAFLKKLENSAVERDATFSDAFTLADYHSKVMDDILSACLLRSSQKSVGDVLRGVLDVILEFGILMSDRQRGILEEYQTTEPLEELFGKFRKRFRTLMKALRVIVDKGSMSSHIPLEDALLHFSADSPASPQLFGVTAKLHNLLTRLDVSMWWTRQQRS